MDISVIIVNYNVREFLNSALTSLNKSLEGFHSEIFVVDNASDDGSVELVASHFPHVHLIANRTNLGFAKANNQALIESKGKYILLINPDTLVQENTVQELIKFFETHDDAGMAGCKILNPDGTLQLACRRSFPTPWTAFTKTFGLSTLFPKSKLFARYNLTYLDPGQEYEVDAISGSFMMVKRATYEKIGGLDETFFMYGEDLDWCYRVRNAGWKVYYVPSTSIIHYKGESTKRSDIDELKVFYNAMKLFVRKHHAGSPLFEWFIYSGIFMRKFIADFGRIMRPLAIALLDMSIVAATLLIGEYFRKDGLFTLPQYAYPWVFIFPAAIVSLALFLNRVYAEHKLSVSRSFTSVFSAFVVIAAIVAFEKDFAFSRMIMLISAGLALITIPGWRLILRLSGFGENSTRATLFGRRTLIVGIDKSGQDVLKKLRARAGGGYSVVGFIDVTRKRIGEKVLDVEIVGSVETIGKVIEEKRISEVIFTSNIIPYSSMLNIIASNTKKFVNFRLVPNTMEVIIGKASIDQLDDIPFIDIEYNIGKLGNRVVKRIFDILVSLCFLICIAPFVYFTRIFSRSQPNGIVRTVLEMSSVLLAKMSIVGYYANGVIPGKNILHGKPGITGLIHIQANKNLTQDEIEQYDLYYAKNQSFMFDLEIIVKALQQWIRR